MIVLDVAFWREEFSFGCLRRKLLPHEEKKKSSTHHPPMHLFPPFFHLSLAIGGGMKVKCRGREEHFCLVYYSIDFLRKFCTLNFFLFFYLLLLCFFSGIWLDREGVGELIHWRCFCMLRDNEVLIKKFWKLWVISQRVNCVNYVNERLCIFFLSVIKLLVRVGVSIESCACYVCFCPLSNISRELFQLLCNATPSHTHASLLWPCPSHKLRWSSTSGGFQRGKMLRKKIL